MPTNRRTGVDPTTFCIAALALALSLPSHMAKAESATNGSTPPVSRPATWAVPLTRDGIPNLFRVSDPLYRSAQPTAEGFRQLRTMGIKTVVNLREFHDDEEILKDTGLAYEHIPIVTWHPETEDVVRFLQIVTDTNRTPVLLHCQHGADRTGTLCALFRIVVQGWSKEEAIKEMTTGGYGFHMVWDNLIEYIRGLDIENIKRQMAGKP